MKAFISTLAFLLSVFEVTRAQSTLRCTMSGVVCPAGTSCDVNTGYCQVFRQATTTQPPNGPTCFGRQCPAGTQCDYNTGNCRIFRQTGTTSSTQLCYGVLCPAGTACNFNTGSCQAIGQACPANSHYDTCGSACPLRCNNQAPTACTLQCVAGCVCDQFYMQVSATNKTCVRRTECPSSSGTTQNCTSVICRAGTKCENGQCVTRTDCPAIQPPILTTGCSYSSYEDSDGCPMVRMVCSGQNSPRCGSNSVYSTCASACPRTCDNEGAAIMCNKMCVEGCICSAGYIFRSNNQTLGCVAEGDCPMRNGDSGLICGTNEEVKSCGACDQYCGRNPRMCTIKCPGGTPQCGCKYGYSRNASGSCVLNSQC